MSQAPPPCDPGLTPTPGRANGHRGDAQGEQRQSSELGDAGDGRPEARQVQVVAIPAVRRDPEVVGGGWSRRDQAVGDDVELAALAAGRPERVDVGPLADQLPTGVRGPPECIQVESPGQAPKDEGVIAVRPKDSSHTPGPADVSLSVEVVIARPAGPVRFEASATVPRKA
jgi:hypothetical protein